ncbi:predicted protein [Naegleria gruberi]|uniref:Predicted protein n=1 Tax=Naegleria gruberi TaxID=5762 RepID=D2W1I8_NAEGR|nr:uncharacterized protein NAEGRDRAFT_75236 [Naegleria gruberi]EFC37053.1 predicted protein [Naegleria gruberi]|eukprot:XP_002669797.1 predicted protein [Naegleria gruberi strain NEG-M]
MSPCLLTDNELMCSDTLMHSFLFLDLSTMIASCSLVSKQFNRVAKSNPIWQILYDKWMFDNMNEFYWTFNHEEFINCFKLSSDQENRENLEDWTEPNDMGPFYWFRKCMEILECLPRLDLKDEEGEYETFYYQLNNRNAATESHLKLATILAIIYGDYSFSLLSDSVVIALRGYLTESEQEIVCPLATFCIMILKSSYLDCLELRETENTNLCVAPFVSGMWMNGLIDVKECCFFNVMDACGYYNPLNGELSYTNESDEGGFSWCPRFFNAGGRYYINTICASNIGPSSIKVEKSERFDYY